MPNKVKIKVIKRNSIKTHKTSEAVSEIKASKQKQRAMREVVSTVSDWINEFQQRREETKQSLERLFPKIGKSSGL